MAYVVISLASEYLQDGSFHVYSPQVPGFHIVEQLPRDEHEVLYNQKVLPRLRETLERRVLDAKVGRKVHLHEQYVANIQSFVPDELRRCMGDEQKLVGNAFPSQVIAEIH
jgi:hypothetical protein